LLVKENITQSNTKNVSKEILIALGSLIMAL
jgi:hypothetical protein